MGVILTYGNSLKWESLTYGDYKDLPDISDWKDWDLFESDGSFYSVYFDKFYNIMVF